MLFKMEKKHCSNEYYISKMDICKQCHCQVTVLLKRPVAQQIKALEPKPGTLSLIPGMHMGMKNSTSTPVNTLNLKTNPKRVFQSQEQNRIVHPHNGFQEFF